MKPGTCELCKREAVIYCDSDSAYLCFSCDTRVHGANFLAARHVRRPICSICYSVDNETLISGVSLDVNRRSVCLSCTGSGGSEDESSRSFSSSESSCISSAESAATDGAQKRGSQMGRRKKVSLTAEMQGMAEIVVANWCRRVVGVESSDCHLTMATRAMRMGLRKMRNVQWRCVAAAAVWMAVEMCVTGDGGKKNAILLRRLEDCSRVPSKVILLVEGKLSRVTRRRHVEAEGWAECS